MVVRNTKLLPERQWSTNRRTRYALYVDPKKVDIIKGRKNPWPSMIP